MHTMNIPPPSLLLGLFFLVSCLETSEGFAWVPALRYNLPPTAASPHRRDVVTTIYSTTEGSTEASAETSSVATQQQKITVPLPEIEYTVGVKRGWKEDGVWMDEDGPRNGPPQNFWRQMSDERIYNDSFDLIQNLLKIKDAAVLNEQKDTSILDNEEVNERIKRLERTNSIRIPSLNRLILGDWAPIVRGGKVVATSTPEEEKSIDIPYRFYVQRTAGQNLAPKTHYGTFEAHLEPGEEITVQEKSSSNAVTSFGVFDSTSDKHENKLVKGYTNAVDGDLFVGGITYVTKYVMIMRQQAKQQESEDESQDTDRKSVV